MENHEETYVVRHKEIRTPELRWRLHEVSILEATVNGEKQYLLPGAKATVTLLSMFHKKDYLVRVKREGELPELLKGIIDDYKWELKGPLKF